MKDLINLSSIVLSPKINGQKWIILSFSNDDFRQNEVVLRMLKWLRQSLKIGTMTLDRRKGVRKEESLK